MITEHKIMEALMFFGAMNSEQIQEKLKMIGIDYELRDVEHVLRILINTKNIRRADYDSEIYILNEAKQ